jgi:hypothetical protein
MREASVTAEDCVYVCPRLSDRVMEPPLPLAFSITYTCRADPAATVSVTAIVVADPPPLGFSLWTS